MARESRRGGRRSLRVGEALRHALAELLARGEGLDPVLDGVSLTVSEVRVSSDLRYARAYVLPLGGEPSDAIIAALRAAAPRLRGPLARSIRLRYAPELEFEIDRSFEAAARMDAVLSDLDPRAINEDEPPQT